MVIDDDLWWYIYIYVDLWWYIYIYTYLHIYICIYLHIYIYTYLHICIYLHYIYIVFIYIRIYLHYISITFTLTLHLHYMYITLRLRYIALHCTHAYIHIHGHIDRHTDIYPYIHILLRPYFWGWPFGELPGLYHSQSPEAWVFQEFAALLLLAPYFSWLHPTLCWFNQNFC
jgi:cytochrome P450 family 4